MISLRKIDVYTLVITALIVISLAIFPIIGSITSISMTDGQQRAWDTIIKTVGGILALSGAAITVLRYFDEKKRSNQVALMEASKDFRSKRQEVYFELIACTSIISNYRGEEKERREAEDKFWIIYWSTLPLISDEQVSIATDYFEDALCDKKLRGEQKFIALRNASMNLARACRKSLGYH